MKGTSPWESDGSEPSEAEIQELRDLQTCAFQAILEVLGRRHTLNLLRVLDARDAWRFTELQDLLGVNPKTLTSRLRELEDHGLLVREAYAEVPPRVEYSLSERGRGLLPIFTILEDWQERFGSSGAEAPAARA